MAVNVYDSAYELARAITESEVYTRYQEARDKIVNDSTALNMINDFRKRQLEFQAKTLMGQELGDEERQSLVRLREVLDLKPAVREFLQAEVRLIQTIAEIQKILADAVDLDLPGLETDDEEQDSTTDRESESDEAILSDEEEAVPS